MPSTTETDVLPRGQTLVTSTKAAVVAAQVDVATKRGLAAIARTAKNTACSADVDFSVASSPRSHEANTRYDYTSQIGYIQSEAACVFGHIFLGHS